MAYAGDANIPLPLGAVANMLVENNRSLEMVRYAVRRHAPGGTPAAAAPPPPRDLCAEVEVTNAAPITVGVDGAAAADAAAFAARAADKRAAREARQREFERATRRRAREIGEERRELLRMAAPSAMDGGAQQQPFGRQAARATGQWLVVGTPRDGDDTMGLGAASAPMNVAAAAADERARRTLLPSARAAAAVALADATRTKVRRGVRMAGSAQARLHGNLRARSTLLSRKSQCDRSIRLA